MQDGWNGAPRPLIDPNTMSADGTVALSYVSPSDDGRLLGYAVSRSGSDRQEIFVRDVATGQDLPDKLVWVKFSGIAWTPDGKGFYYTRYPETGSVPAGDEHYFPKLHYHRLGDSQEKDVKLFEKPTEKEVGVGGAVSHDGRWLLIFPGKGASNKTEVWVQDLKARGAKPVAVFTGYEHAVPGGGHRGRPALCADGPGRSVRPRHRRGPHEAFEGQPGCTVRRRSFRRERTRSRAPRSSIGSSWCADSATRAPLSRCAASRASSRRRSRCPASVRSAGSRGTWTTRICSWLTTPSPSLRRTSATTSPRASSSPFHKTEVKVDPSLYETEQVWYPSKDGTKVSMFLIHKKGLAKDGNRPVYLYAYGGFNVNQTPGFSGTRYVFLEKDGIVAIPNLRGGGEYGEAWHQAGMREKKQNVFDDFIAAAEWLVASGYTKRDRLAIGGGSNGGLLVSAVMMQRPDLYGAVICQVPVADMLRYHRFTVGRYWISEYGSAEVAEDFPFLYKYSPLHNVREGVSYPATIITTADTDDRVDPGHSKKLAARLQEAQAGDEPILIRVETKAGHGAGKPTTKILDEQADVWTFLFSQLGMI